MTTTYDPLGPRLDSLNHGEYVASKHIVRSTTTTDSSPQTPTVLHHRPHANAELVDFFYKLLSIVGVDHKVIFLCELLGDKEYFVLIQNKSQAALFVMTQRGNLIFGTIAVPVLASTTVALHGKGVFAVVSPKLVPNTLYFETLSMHAMWAAIVSLETLRDQTKTMAVGDKDLYFAWMQDYFNVANITTVFETMDVEKSITQDEPQDDAGEGGKAIVIVESKSPRLSSEQMLGARIWENLPGKSRLMFTLEATRRRALSELSSSSLSNSSSTSRKYEKPTLEELSNKVADFVGGVADPDDLSMVDIQVMLKSAFGVEIIGKYGYSNAMIDKVVYKVFGMMDPPSQISDRLYLGSEYNAANKAQLLQLGVTYILNVTVEVEKFFPDDFTYHQVCVLDSPNANLLPSLDRGLDFIEDGLNSGGAVLVHCQRGVSRSASFVIAHIMKSQHLSLEDALKLVKGKRKIVKPNTGFISQLKDFEVESRRDFQE